MLGSVIKYERVKQDMKQELLCKNICSVSYLSKIESNSAAPSTEVTTLLFKKLGIEYQHNLAGNDVKLLFAKVKEHCFYQVPNPETLKALLHSLQNYLYSSFFWEVYVNILYLLSLLDEPPLLDIPLPKEMENHPYVVLSLPFWGEYAHNHQGLMNRLLYAKGQDDTGAIDLRLAHLCFETGAFDASITYAQSSLHTFSQKGNAFNMLNAHLQLGNSYVYSNFEKAVAHYESARRLNQYIGDPEADYYICYNLSADYYDQYLFTNEKSYIDKAHSLIQKAEEHLEEKDFLFYEKTIFINLEVGDRAKANGFFEQIDQRLITPYPGIDYQHEYTVLAYACSHSHYQQDRAFTALLKRTYDHSCRRRDKYTRSLFLRNMLLNAYRKQKNYKKVMELLNFPKNKVFD